MPYLHQNRFDPKPLELEGVRGIAVDQNGNVMAQLCVGLFSEPDHQLLRYAQSDNKGAFTVETKGLPDGQYRFVGQLVGFCPANAVVNINSRSQKKKLLEVHMSLPGTTTCSYVKVRKNNTISVQGEN